MLKNTAATATPSPKIYSISGSYFSNITSLTTDNPQNYYLFSVSSDRYMALGFTTGNAKYDVQLYQYQVSTKTYLPTNVVLKANQTYTLHDLPAGSYLLDVFSAGTVGDNYTIAMNSANPANPTYVYRASFSDMLCGYSDGLYNNGSVVYKDGTSNSNLDWIRNDYFSWSGENSGDYKRTQQIYSAAVNKSRKIQLAINYKSDYVNADNVILIPLDVGTGFLYRYSSFQNNQMVINTWTDVYGKQTPRTLDTSDIERNPQYLVYDLDSNKAIDFYTDLNYFYYSGKENASWTNVN